jgi:hypothetical protein
MYSAQKKWLQFSFFNLMLVAMLGVTLRYKIAFSLPFIDQQNLLHGHSHFAFGGWVTQALMTLLVGYLSERSGKNYFKTYRWILYFNAAAAYGMLFSFPVQGYGFVSILFSTLSVFASYFFAFYYWLDLNRLKRLTVSDRWFKMALIGNVLSSAGPFSLAYMMSSGNMHQTWYLASIYLYLHFQYNIWFFFSCMGLLSYKLRRVIMPVYPLNKVFYCFTIAAIPTYFLSLLWAQIPVWLYLAALFGAAIQLYGWAILLLYLRKYFAELKKGLSFFSRVLFQLAGLAVTIKLLLQTTSIVPSVSKLAFGFRPIIIGYLHLILLGIITLFIVGYTFTFELVQKNEIVKNGIRVFVTGILFNELILMSQGASDILNTAMPYVNILLLVAALTLCAGTGMMVAGFFFYKDDPDHKKLPVADRHLKKNEYGKYHTAIHCIPGT